MVLLVIYLFTKFENILYMFLCSEPFSNNEWLQNKTFRIFFVYLSFSASENSFEHLIILLTLTLGKNENLNTFTISI